MRLSRLLGRFRESHDDHHHPDDGEGLAADLNGPTERASFDAQPGRNSRADGADPLLSAYVHGGEEAPSIDPVVDYFLIRLAHAQKHRTVALVAVFHFHGLELPIALDGGIHRGRRRIFAAAEEGRSWHRFELDRVAAAS